MFPPSVFFTSFFSVTPILVGVNGMRRKMVENVNGILFGKFLPPHLGHLHCIETAFQNCSKLFIVVCTTKTSQPSGRDRAKWIQQLAPRAEVLLTDDLCEWHFGKPCVDRCSNTWATWLGQVIAEKIDVVFSSEEYGQNFAKLVDANHVSIDPGRVIFSVSGSQIRADWRKNWLDMPAVVRTGLFRKIVIVGSESSGTSTLASDLAAIMQAPLVAEVGRMISWELAIQNGGMGNVDWNEQVFWRVLRDQADAENIARFQNCDLIPGEFGPWIVCDTDAVATVVWWERYLSADSNSAWNFAETGLGDIYVVTDPSDVDFWQDGIRDGEHLRFEMHNSFLEVVERTKKAFVVARGSREERVQQILDVIRNLETSVTRMCG